MGKSAYNTDMGNVKDIKYIENRISTLTEEYTQLAGKSPNELTHIEYNAYLKYLYLNIPLKELAIKKNTSNKPLNWKSSIQPDDIELIQDIIDIYTTLCYRDNKVCSLRGFKVFTGIEENYITHNKENTDSIAYYIYRAVQSDRESSLADCSLHRNVMALALGKCQFGWTEGQPQSTTNNIYISTENPFKLLDKYRDS